MAVDISKMESYSSPISNALFGNLAIVLIFLGLLSTTWLFIGANSTKQSRSLFKEFIGALVSSVILGSGVLFLFLWVGVYV
ncbi:hypothetical protein M3Y97_00056900 [Aphelenchoides bicaudatus]|nr:hypothetical protein M3Y97_00056900 [Aphelenchoides bicaudatus]